MLQIRSVHFLPDGRSVVDTIGGKRFRVLSRGMKDGYSIANIKYLEDMKVRTSMDFYVTVMYRNAGYDLFYLETLFPYPVRQKLN